MVSEKKRYVAHLVRKLKLDSFIPSTEIPVSARCENPNGISTILKIIRSERLKRCCVILRGDGKEIERNGISGIREVFRFKHTCSLWYHPSS